MKVNKTKVFDKNRITLDTTETQNEQSFIRFVKENMAPKQTYCLHISEKTLEITFLRIIQEFFKINALSLYISDTVLTDVTNEHEQKLKLK